ncbi:MAG: hypothetical protein KJO04_04755 [Bacteroidia bacterium]|nr:hypothetical protein [Bacteroidia bacterium]
MKYIVYLFGALMIVAGILLFIDENIVLGYIESNQESSWLYFFAVVMRLIMGAALVKTASISRFPLVFKIIGYIALAAAFIFLIIGHDRFIHVLSTLVPYFENTGGWVGIFALAFGVFLIYGLKKK